MKYKKLYNKETKKAEFAIEIDGQWKLIESNESILTNLLNTPFEKIKILTQGAIENSESYKALIPFQPTAYRDFMLYEKHAIDAAREVYAQVISSCIDLRKSI